MPSMNSPGQTGRACTNPFIFTPPKFSFMKLIRLFSVLLLFVLSLQGSAQFSLSAPIPTDPNVRIGKLANGITYYIRKNVKPEKKIELRLAVNAGSILEDNDQRGLA